MFPPLRTLLAVGTVLTCLPLVSAEINNPLIKQRADPHLTLDADGYYYYTATVPEYDRLEIRRARTLADLPKAESKVIWKKHESGAMGSHIWAPELHHIDGKWYVYFAAGGSKDVWAIRMYVLENESPNPLEGKWIEKGQIRTKWETFSLDASTFVHQGQRYLIWAQADPAIKSNTNLYLSKMDTPWSVTGPQVMLSQPDLPWERIGYKVNEGPTVIARNGRIFLTYSAAATDANYCLGLLTAKDDADLLQASSWTKAQQPVFKTSDATSQFGPGHNCFTTTADGKTDLLVYHSRNYRDIKGDPLHNPDRHTRVQPFTWNADGTPHFGVPVADGALKLP